MAWNGFLLKKSASTILSNLRNWLSGLADGAASSFSRGNIRCNQPMNIHHGCSKNRFITEETNIKIRFSSRRFKATRLWIFGMVLRVYCGSISKICGHQCKSSSLSWITRHNFVLWRIWTKNEGTFGIIMARVDIGSTPRRVRVATRNHLSAS